MILVSESDALISLGARDPYSRYPGGGGSDACDVSGGSDACLSSPRSCSLGPFTPSASRRFEVSGIAGDVESGIVSIGKLPGTADDLSGTVAGVDWREGVGDGVIIVGTREFDADSFV